MSDLSSPRHPSARAYPGSPRRAGLLCLLLPVLLSACASRQRTPLEHSFAFGRDTFSYGNELVWIYEFDDATGASSSRRRTPPPDYSHQCFIVVRSARQFFQFARFDPSLPKVDVVEYRRRVRVVVGRDPARDQPSEERTVIPGYPNLHAFSRDHESLLKEVCGGSWQSYFQRGHWRMIFPFSKRHQTKVTERLMRELDANRPPVVHLVRFPSLKINHAMMIFGYQKEKEVIRFDAYDPNSPDHSEPLTFDRATRVFHLPHTEYFLGGIVDVYPIYDSWVY